MTAPAVGPPGSWDQNAVAPVYVDGMPLESLVDAIRLNQTQIDQRAATDYRFWSSPRRWQEDGTLEIYQVNLSIAKPINVIAFELAHFPHRVWTEWWDTKQKKWRPCMEYLSTATTKRPASKPSLIWVTDSMPSVLLPASNLRPGEHPQHYGAGHWVAYEVRCASITTNQIRLCLQRVRGEKFPRDTNNQAVQYSLGVRGLVLGYRADVLTDLPFTQRNDTVATEQDTFASTTDLLGSSVEFAVRKNRAADLLRGYVWRSEPQPVPYAVVNFYVDGRDPHGAPQVVDRFDIEPLYSGAHVNLYWSDDDPADGVFTASDDVLSFPASRGSGVAITQNGEGLLFPAPFAYVDIDNGFIQWDVTRPWWMGLVFQPQYEMTDTTVRYVLDSSACTVWVQQGALFARVGAAVMSLPLSFSYNDRIGFLLGYQGGQVTLSYGGQTVSTTMSAAVLQPATIRLGASAPLDASPPSPGLYRLNSLILKQGPLPGDEELVAFLEDPTAYITKPEYISDDTGTTDNALLRYDPLFQTLGEGSVNPYGLLGGPGLAYEDLVWHPINRDFKAVKGTMSFDPTRAKFWKFEFTSLVPQPFSVARPTTRTVRVFSSEIMDSAIPRTSSVSLNTGGSGVTVSKDLGPTITFADSSRVVPLDLSRSPSRSYSATEVVYSGDPAVAAKMAAASNLLNFQLWHPNTWIPRFSTIGRHVYESVEVQVNNRVGYFAGLKSLQMYRVDYVVDDDTEQYVENLHDTNGLDIDGARLTNGLTWNYEPSRLRTPSSIELDAAVMQSRVFHSYRSVKGVQFATQQSPPVQLLADPDFSDTTLQYWAPWGDAAVEVSTAYNTDIGTTVSVTRGTAENFWGNLELRFASWDEIEASDPDVHKPTWDDLEGGGVDAQPEGGVRSTQFVTSSLSGRIYAAARVFIPQVLTAPLVLQLVSDKEVVLAEAETETHPGQIAEWYVGYTVGELPDSGTLITWDQLEAQPGTVPDTDPAHPTYTELEARGTWDDLDNNPATPDTASGGQVGQIYARLIQREPSQDAWQVDNISIFEDPIAWEFSNDGGATFWRAYDIRNDPHGVMMFPAVTSANPDVGRSLMWRVKGFRSDLSITGITIRPWYDSLTRGVPYQDTISPSGPNTTPQDQYNPIQADPRFLAWHQPIPQEWWFIYRQWLARVGAQFTNAPVVPTRPFYASDRIVVPVDTRITLTTDIVIP